MRLVSPVQRIPVPRRASRSGCRSAVRPRLKNMTAESARVLGLFGSSSSARRNAILAPFQSPVHRPAHPAQRDEHLGRIRLQFGCPWRCRFRASANPTGISIPPHRAELDVRPSHLSPCGRVIRLEGYRALEADDCRLEVRSRGALHPVPTLQEKLIGLRVDARLRGRRCIQLHLEILRHKADDLILQCKDVLHLPVEIVRPHLEAVRGVDQLRGNAHAVALLLDASLDDECDAELPSLDGGDGCSCFPLK